VLPETPRIIVGGIGGLIVFLGIVLWFTAYLNARQMDRGLSAIGKARQPYAARQSCREPIRCLKIEIRRKRVGAEDAPTKMRDMQSRFRK